MDSQTPQIPPQASSPQPPQSPPYDPHIQKALEGFKQAAGPNSPCPNPPPPGLPCAIPNYRAYTPLPKRPFDMARGDLAFTLVSAVLGFFFVRFIIWGGLGLGAGVFALLFIGAAMVWLKLNGAPLSAAVWPWALLLFLSAVYFALYDNPELKALILLLDIAMGAWVVAAGSGSRVEDKIGRFVVLDGLDALLLAPLSHMGTWFGAIGAGIQKQKKNKNILFLLAGLAAALPVLLIIGSVLSLADPVFQTFWEGLLENFWSGISVIIAQLLLSVPVTLYLHGMFYGNRHHRHHRKRAKPEAEKLLEKKRVIPQALLMGLIFPVLLLYLVFFTTQTAYFLSAFQNLVPEGFSASEYARRGFYELCFVSGFNLGLWAVLRVFGQKGKNAALHHVIGIALSAVSLGMLVIVLRKMALNIHTYGLTLPRVYTTAFMLLLGLWFVLTVIRMFAPAFPLERAAAALVIIMLMGLSFSSPNSWIAHYNVSAHQAGRLKKLDIDDMAALGSPATPALIRVAADEEIDAAFRKTAARYLRARMDAGAAPGWKRANLSDLRSGRLIRENRALVEMYWPDPLFERDAD